MKGQKIKSKRYSVQLCRTLSGHMVAGDVEFVMRDRLNKLKSKSAMIVRLAQTIYSKYYILLFPLNLIITIIVILLAYSTVCSYLIIVLHQARGLLPVVD